jgi:hypothetical protein
MNSSNHLHSAISHFAPSIRLELQLKSDTDFASWFHTEYRPLAGAWQY